MFNKNEFAITRDLFSSNIHFTKPLTYQEWLDVSDDSKSAVLYCQFYDQITLAWYKLKSVYSDEADGVAETLQYLQKNVDLIKRDKKKFTPAYIYRVVYNCLYCLCRDPNRYKAVYENERSSIVYKDGEELDMLDFAGHMDSYFKENKEVLVSRFWKLIEDEIDRRESQCKGSGKDLAIVVSEMLGDNLDFTGKFHEFDLQPAKGAETREYKKVEECSVKNASIKRADIERTWNGKLRSEIVETPFTRGGKDLVKFSYVVEDVRQYRGVSEFSEKERASVSDESRVSVVESLKAILSPFKEAFC